MCFHPFASDVSEFRGHLASAIYRGSVSFEGGAGFCVTLLPICSEWFLFVEGDMRDRCHEILSLNSFLVLMCTVLVEPVMIKSHI
jgi:hypothetical protein